MNAFTSQRAATWTYRLSAFGGSLEQVVHDGAKDGTANVTLMSGGRVAHASIILDGKAYFEGNAVGLAELEGLKPAVAAKEANKWIAVDRSSAFFAAYANNLTVASAVEELYLGGTVKALPPTTVGRLHVLVVHESLSAHGTSISENVYMRASGLRLPVKVVLVIDGVPGSIVYGPWGKPPAATVPPKSVPLQKAWVANA